MFPLKRNKGIRAYVKISISLVPLSFPYAAQILLENALFTAGRMFASKIINFVLLKILPAEYNQAYHSLALRFQPCSRPFV